LDTYAEGAKSWMAPMVGVGTFMTPYPKQTLMGERDGMNWVKPMENSLRGMMNSSDIEEQRDSFSALSDNMYKSVKAFGLGGAEAFYEYCPMAFNNEGAYWLSDNEQIRNPYFGDKMLKCGVVKERLK
jgi:hypothetical protein